MTAAIPRRTWSTVKLATAGVLVEMPLVYLGLCVWGMSQPVPEGEPGPDSPALAVFALPVLLPVAAAVAFSSPSPSSCPPPPWRGARERAGAVRGPGGGCRPRPPW